MHNIIHHFKIPKFHEVNKKLNNVFEDKHPNLNNRLIIPNRKFYTKLVNLTDTTLS